MSAFRDRSIRPGRPATGADRARIAGRPFSQLLPTVMLVAVACAGLTLVAIGARSPDTHANLAAGFDAAYERTPQTVVGEETGLAARPGTGDGLARGARLYVKAGCAGCHGLQGRGGTVGPRIAGVDPELVADRVRLGPLGMPRFSPSGLTDEQVADIAAFLGSLATD